MSTSPKRILLAGGGTGGHVFPLVNLVQHIQKRHKSETQLYWAGLQHSLEEKETKKLYDVRFLKIFSGKLRREKSFSALIQNIKDIFFLSVGVVQSLSYLVRHRIDVIFCKGGYVALPVVLASYISRTTLVVHESDTKLGLTSRLAVYRAKKVFSAFDLAGQKSEIVGQLLSNDLAQNHSREEFQALLAVATQPEMTHVLVMGGSQGARSLYTTLASIIASGKEFNKMHFIVISGLLNQENIIFDGLDNVTILDFVDQKTMAALLKHCDIGVVRAGTTSLAEQKIRDLRLIIVPLPRTHDQQTNAEYYVREYHDELVIQDGDLELHLANTLREYLGYHKILLDKEREKIVSLPTESVTKYLLSSN